MNTPGDNRGSSDPIEAISADNVELNPENTAQVAEYIAKIRDTRGIQKMQSWFNGLEESTQRKLLRAEDVSTIQKLLEKIPTPPGALDITKSMIIMMSLYGVLEVREDILAESRGVSGDMIYHLPEGAVTMGLRALGASNLIPLYKIGKKIHSGDQTYAPRIRQAVKTKLARKNPHHGDNQGSKKVA